MLEVNVIMRCRDCGEIAGEDKVRATHCQSRSESFVVGGSLTRGLLYVCAYLAYNSGFCVIVYEYDMFDLDGFNTMLAYLG